MCVKSSTNNSEGKRVSSGSATPCDAPLAVRRRSSAPSRHYVEQKKRDNNFNAEDRSLQGTAGEEPRRKSERQWEGNEQRPKTDKKCLYLYIVLKMYLERPSVREEVRAASSTISTTKGNREKKKIPFSVRKEKTLERRRKKDISKGKHPMVPVRQESQMIRSALIF